MWIIITKYLKTFSLSQITKCITINYLKDTFIRLFSAWQEIQLHIPANCSEHIYSSLKVARPDSGSWGCWLFRRLPVDCTVCEWHANDSASLLCLLTVTGYETVSGSTAYESRLLSVSEWAYPCTRNRNWLRAELNKLWATTKNFRG